MITNGTIPISQTPRKTNVSTSIFTKNTKIEEIKHDDYKYGITFVVQELNTPIFIQWGGVINGVLLFPHHILIDKSIRNHSKLNSLKCCLSGR